MRNTKRIATSGIMAALSCVIMYIASVTDIFSLSGVIFAAFAIVFVYIEYGTKTALTVYAAVSVISILIVPDKFSAALFAIYAGYYPILKAKLEGFRPRLSWILKLASFDLTLVLLYLAGRFILFVEFEMPIVELTVFVLANVVFIMADLLASRLIVLYLKKFRPRLKRRGLI